MGRMAPSPPPRTLPPYDELMSDGCSLAPFLPVRWRGRFQDWTIGVIAKDPERARRMRAICVVHDRQYYYGGTKAERLAADKRMRRSLGDAGAPGWYRYASFRAVRIFGGPGYRTSGVSWGFGGSYFKYGVRALASIEIVRPGQAQDPKPPLSGHDLWPFNEARCDCPDDTPLWPVSWVHQCSGCQRVYTRRTV